MGKAFGLPDIDALLTLCSDLSIGIVKVPFASDTEIQVDVCECVSCAGMIPVGRALCSLEGRLIAGGVEGIAKAPVTAKERRSESVGWSTSPALSSPRSPSPGFGDSGTPGSETSARPSAPATESEQHDD